VRQLQLVVDDGHFRGRVDGTLSGPGLRVAVGDHDAVDDFHSRLGAMQAVDPHLGTRQQHLRHGAPRQMRHLLDRPAEYHVLETKLARQGAVVTRKRRGKLPLVDDEGGLSG
jgi:hypothetical protein